jgi:hypothetical protein
MECPTHVGQAVEATPNPDHESNTIGAEWSMCGPYDSFYGTSICVFSFRSRVAVLLERPAVTHTAHRAGTSISGSGSGRGSSSSCSSSRRRSSSRCCSKRKPTLEDDYTIEGSVRKPCCCIRGQVAQLTAHVPRAVQEVLGVQNYSSNLQMRQQTLQIEFHDMTMSG